MLGRTEVHITCTYAGTWPGTSFISVHIHTCKVFFPHCHVSKAIIQNLTGPKIPYSGKFLHGAKFRAFHGYVGCRENKNHESLNGQQNSDVIAYMYKHTCYGVHRDRTCDAKIKTTLISTRALTSNEILHHRKFPPL